jgi:hypothetical protein
LINVVATRLKCWLVHIEKTWRNDLYLQREKKGFEQLPHTRSLSKMIGLK